jgi:hypothetical protein
MTDKPVSCQSAGPSPLANHDISRRAPTTHLDLQLLHLTLKTTHMQIPNQNISLSQTIIP